MNTQKTRLSPQVSNKSLLSLLEPEPPFWSKTSWIQLGYGIWVNLTLVNTGLCLGFSAVAIPQLKSEGSEILVTRHDEGMLAGVLSLVAPIGCLISGVILDRCGRKAGLILCQIPIAVGWFYIAFAKSASDIIVGRVVGGIGLGMNMAAPRAYLSEITLPNMRGVLGTLPNLAISLGITIQGILGSFFDWRTLCYVCAGYAIALFCANNLLVESPYYKLLKSNVSEAKIALKRLRSANFNLDEELKNMADFKEVNHLRSLTFLETLKALISPSACKPFSIIFTYVTLMHLCGVTVITAYAVEMLQLAQSSIDPHLGNVSLAVVRVIASIGTSFLLYRVGRRPLALVSALGVGVVGCVLAGGLHFTENGTAPLVLMLSFITLAVPGYLTLPTLMMFELFPLQIKGVLSGIVLAIGSLIMFGVIHSYPITRDTIGLANIFLLFGGVSLIGAIILYFILPETKGLTLQEIEEYYNSRRNILISQRTLLSLQLQSRIMSGIDLRKQQPRQVHKKKQNKNLTSTVGSKEKFKSNIELSQSSEWSIDDVVMYDDAGNPKKNKDIVKTENDAQSNSVESSSKSENLSGNNKKHKTDSVQENKNEDKKENLESKKIKNKDLSKKDGTGPDELNRPSSSKDT